jgi:hypothetical protein
LATGLKHKYSYTCWKWSTPKTKHWIISSPHWSLSNPCLITLSTPGDRKLPTFQSSP